MVRKEQYFENLSVQGNEKKGGNDASEKKQHSPPTENETLKKKL